MKTRQGFVSNSSTSSFCIYGTEIDQRDFIEKVKKIKPDLEEIVEEDGLYEMAFVLQDYLPLEIYTPCDYEGVFVGRSWSSIGDDETGKKLKESVEVQLREFFGEDFKCSTIAEAWAS